MKVINWHTFNSKQVFARLKSSAKGLTSKEAKKRLGIYGHNELQRAKPLSRAVILLRQLASPLVYLLVGAAAVALLLQNYMDGLVILVAVVLNTILGYFQEVKADASINRIKMMIDYHAKVMRNGSVAKVSSSDLVPGDVITLEPGDRVPADARLFKVDELEINESSLTGESSLVKKTTKNVAVGTNVGDRKGMVFQGTGIAAGRGQAIVCETGSTTELGKISKLLHTTEERKTPLQFALSKFSRTMTLVVIALSLGIAVIGVLQGRPLLGIGEAAREGMLNTAVAIAVAAIPEGLLVAVTVILSIGMQQILKRRALVRKLIATETLGSTSVICTDKTGTLTEGRMAVTKIVTYEENVNLRRPHKYTSSEVLKDHDLILKIAMLCNNAVVENPADELSKLKVIGNPTERALMRAGISSGIDRDDLEKVQPRLAEIPFDSSWKYMVTHNKLNKSQNVVYVKGAPEKVLAMCSKVRINGRKPKFSKTHQKHLQEQYEKLTSRGLRLLAFGYKKVSSSAKLNLREELKGMTFIGFVALQDPLRKEAKQTIQLSRKAGIRPIVITGDHRLTARAIAAEVGLKTTPASVIDGESLDKLDDDQLAKKLSNIDVYARVEPRHKLRIIKAWQDKGEVVAMTGDGVNDAPALKAADIGIALGSGTDVAKETADIILLDNNFKTIIAAVAQGRVIFDNIKKVILYLLSDSFSELLLIGVSLLLGLPTPLLPAQILWINLVTDGFPDVALAFEKGEPENMTEPPRKRGTSILDRDMKVLIFIIGIITDVILLAVYYFLLQGDLDLPHVRTIIFAALGVDSLLYVFSVRSLRHSVFTINPFKNRWLVVAVGIGAILQLAAIYEPHLQNVFGTVSLGKEWWLIGALGVIEIIAIETGKYFLIIRRARKRAERKSQAVLAS
ncbi:ATPase [archaeon]|nr:ATPase [archaeon]